MRSRRLQLASANSHLLMVPHVVQDHILGYLTISEQLKVRQLCKTTKEWVDRNQARIADHNPVTKISDSFSRFLQRRVPHLITSLQLDNLTLEVFEKSSHLTEFLERFAGSITSLRLKRLFLSNNNDKQTCFIEALYSLESIEVDEIWVSNEGEPARRVPENFRNLKTLKLGYVKVYNETNYNLIRPERLPLERKKKLRFCVWNSLESCEGLRYLRVPVTPKTLQDTSFDECFRLLNYIRIRTRGIRERERRAQLPIMKCDLYDFQCCTTSLEVLLVVGVRMGIGFLNVNSKVFKRGSSFSVIGIPPRLRFDYIQSLLSSSLINRTFENIQKLIFKASLIQNECIIGREKVPDLLPNLKELNLIFDIGVDESYPNSVYSRANNNEDGPTSRHVCYPRAIQMLKVFFPPNMHYNLLETLSVEFYDPVFPYQKRAEEVPPLSQIIECLPNLKNLSIKGWKCKEDAYFKLFNGFSRIRKLVIDRCETLKKSCFLTGNKSPNNPANFTLMPNLEYIELRGLEEMPHMQNPFEVFEKMGFQPLKFKKDVWIRTSASKLPVITLSTIVTRSVSNAMVALQGTRKRKRK